MSVNSKMTAIADAIRAKTGGTGLLTLDDMAQDIAAIDTSENLDDVLDEQESIIDQIQAALEGKAAASVEFGWFSVAGVHLNSHILYQLPFLIGMTWGEWVETTLNLLVNNSNVVNTQFYSSGNYIGFMSAAGNNGFVSVDGTETGRVTIDDEIQSNYEYMSYVNVACCFTAGTQVLTSLDGDTSAIEDVVVGDYVVSYNIDTEENYLTEVQRITVKENTTDIAEVYFDNGSIVTMNAYHPLYTENGFHSITRYKGYDELVIGDVVKTLDGWTTVADIKRYTSEPIITYNLDVRDAGEDPDVDTNDTYYANGIVVKNGFC